MPSCAVSRRRRRRSSHGETGRLIFAMDATASREPTWDRACQIQGEMFDATAAARRALGAARLLPGLRRVPSEQVGARFARACARHDRRPLPRWPHPDPQGAAVTPWTKPRRSGSTRWSSSATAMEENVDELCAIAGELGLRGVPAFMFHEGPDPAASHWPFVRSRGSPTAPTCASIRLERATAQGPARRSRGLCRRWAQGAQVTTAVSAAKQCCRSPIRSNELAQPQRTSRPIR